MQCKYQSPLVWEQKLSNVPPFAHQPCGSQPCSVCPSRAMLLSQGDFRHFKLKNTFPQHKMSWSAIHTHDCSSAARLTWNKYTSPVLLCTTLLVQELDPSILFAAIHASITWTESNSSMEKDGNSLARLVVHKTAVADITHRKRKGTRGLILSSQENTQVQHLLPHCHAKQRVCILLW